MIGHSSEWGTFQTLAHDNPSLQTIQRWILSLQWRDTQTRSKCCLPPRSRLFPPPHICSSQVSERTILLRTLQSQCGLCLPSHSILRMLFLGDIFNQGVVHHIPLKRGSKSSRNRSLLGVPMKGPSKSGEPRGYTGSGEGEPEEVGWKLQLRGTSVR